jgi:hypothetical protein
VVSAGLQFVTLWYTVAEQSSAKIGVTTAKQFHILVDLRLGTLPWK